MKRYRIKNGPLIIGAFRTEREAVVSHFGTHAIALMPMGWMDCSTGKVVNVEEVR